MKARWIFWILGILLCWFIISHLTEIGTLLKTLQKGQVGLILIAAFIQIIFFVLVGRLYQLAFKAVGIESKLLRLIPVTIGSLFINFTAPSLGLGGTALFIKDNQKHGYPAAKTSAGYILETVFQQGSFMILSIFALIYLAARNRLYFYETIAWVILFVMTSALVVLIVVGGWKPRLLSTFFRLARIFLNKYSKIFKKNRSYDDEWQARVTSEFQQSALSIRNHPKTLIEGMITGFFAQFLVIIQIFILFLAFQNIISPAWIISAYCISYVVGAVSIFPQGAGVVEALMPVIFAQLGSPGSTATLVTLTYRGIATWIPLLLGFILLRRTRTFSE